MIDSLKIFELLKTHLPEQQARTVTHAIQQVESEITTDLKSFMIDRFATKADLAQMEARLMRWMFIFWAGQVAVTVGLLKLIK